MVGPLGGRTSPEIIEAMKQMEVPFKTMDDVDFEGKVVLLRTDMNLPLDPKTGMPVDTTRMEVLAKSTLTELLVRGARVAILTHQGRPGDANFTTTDLHAKLLSNMLKTRVKYVPDIYGSTAIEAFKKLREGRYRIVMLENVRMDKDEMIKRPFEKQAATKQVQVLSVLADIYVNDAFAACHRNNVSLTGYPLVMPAVAGRVLEWEYRALTWVLKHSQPPRIFILGGAKLDDVIMVTEHVLSTKKAECVAMTGVAGHLFLAAAGHDLGEVNMKVLERKGGLLLLEDAKNLYEKYGEKIIMPVDVAVEASNGERAEIPVSLLPLNRPIKDIGSRTAGIIEDKVLNSKTIVMSGPAGVYEENNFIQGTKMIAKAISLSEGFSVVGGGDTVAAIRKLGMENGFSHVSTGGGALIEMLVENPLPGIEALKRASIH